ncbi:histone acetyltransferase [Halobacteroides halobius DSM 5150]|uniref:Histone acetyltransferase n=1 Tax=Halobacteroides halobius (strain ATCC 35273 / DSM 5150 / MD-1) TaxID=748449 RepID=L0K5M6_HALHC|nr:radical SAM protein [Halobacteroides halobius]AGB40592.1 histone acetyltransferase [Halobacteroides halobius DSM 5150]
MSNRNYIIPVFVPHLGCPHDCVFCNQEEITGIKKRINPQEVNEQINDYLATIPKSANRIEVAFYGGSFTAIEQEYQQQLLTVAQQRLEQDDLTGVRLSTRPDYITSEILKYLQEFGVTTIELGVQSLDNQVLKAAGRGHTRLDVQKAVSLIKEYSFALGLQMMPGLPQSTVESDLRTGREIIALTPDFVRIYPTLVIKGTKLEGLYQQGDYQPLVLSQAVDLVARLVVKFRKAAIPVIRVGLQPSEGVNKDEVIAGPFHSSFRQLVDSKLMLDKVIKQIKAQKLEKITVIINPKDESNLRGQKNKNLIYLKENYDLKQINIEASRALARGEIKVLTE